MGALGVLLLAAVVQAGQIPVWDAVKRFPDASYWPGGPEQRTANMLQEIRRDVGGQMRWAGPGPQQLAARWATGKLSGDEKVAVLLTGADFHHPCLLPVYAAALETGEQRVRQAALIGLHWLLGEAAPDATRIPPDAPVWAEATRFARIVASAAQRRTLVQIWADSYVATTGQRREGRLVFDRSGDQCLAAIREIATPADLNTLVALWPLLVSQNHRYSLMLTIEMVSLQKFVEIAKSPRGGWAPEVFYDASARRLDDWVASRCGWVDGVSMVEQKAAEVGAASGTGPLGGWLAITRAGYPPVWPTVADALLGYGAPAVWLNRQQPSDPGNEEAMRRLREHFPVTMQLLAAPAPGGRRPVR